MSRWLHAAARIIEITKKHTEQLTGQSEPVGRLCDEVAKEIEKEREREGSGYRKRILDVSLALKNLWLERADSLPSAEKQAVFESADVLDSWPLSR